jgi:hypothetical protein
MPQIWMTYMELGHLLGCAPEDARERAIADNLDRKKSRDGRARVKLSPAWMMVFIEQLRNADRFSRVAQEIQSLPHMKPAAEVQVDGETVIIETPAAAKTSNVTPEAARATRAA